MNGRGPAREFVNTDGVFRMPSTSHAVRAGGHIWVTGVLGTLDGGLALPAGGIGPETTQAIANLASILDACGASLADVVRVDAYLVAVDDFLEFDRAYAEAMPVQPARVTVYAAAMPLGARVELAAQAWVGEG